MAEVTSGGPGRGCHRDFWRWFRSRARASRNPKSPLASARGAPRLLERKDALPVSLHIHHGPVIHGSGVQRLVESAEVRFAIICVFTFGVGVMNENAKAYSTAHGRPLQHFEVAIRVAKG